MTAITRWVCTRCGLFTTVSPDAYGEQRPCDCLRCGGITMAVLMTFAPDPTKPRRPRQRSLPGIRGRRRPAAYRAQVP